MRREGFLKLAAGVVLAPYLAKIPTAPAAAIAPEATVLTVTGASTFQVGDILRCVTTGEAMNVKAISGRSITVVRGIGSLVPQPIAPRSGLLRIARAAYEGEPLGVSDSPKLATILRAA